MSIIVNATMLRSSCSLYQKSSLLSAGVKSKISTLSFSHCCASKPFTVVLSQHKYNTSKLNVNQKRHLSKESSFVNNLIEFQTSLFNSISYSTPVHYAQEVLIFIHNTSGLAWGPTVVLSAFLLRFFLTFPLSIYQVSQS